MSGATIEGLGRRGKYLLLGLDRRQTLVMHLRMTGNLVLVEGEDKLDPSEGMRLYEGERSTAERHLRARFVLDDGRELWFTDPRRFGEAFLIDDDGARGALRAARGRAALRRVHAGGAGRARRRPHGAAEVVPARPVADRRRRQHLRRRGALPGPPAPALAGRLDAARAPPGAARRRRRRARGGDRRRRRLDRRLPRRPRREGRRCRTSSSSTPARASRARAAAGRSSRIVVGGRSTYYCPGCQVRLRQRRRRRAPSGPSVNLGSCPERRSRRRRSSCAASATARPTASSTSTRRARGRIGAIAKGARRPRSRFGGRLEPFFRLDLLLHEGRGELLTVTGVSTVDGYPRLRSSAPALTAGARACDAVLRLLDSAEPNPPAYNLLCRYLAMLDDPGRASGRPRSRRRSPSG